MAVILDFLFGALFATVFGVVAAFAMAPLVRRLPIETARLGYLSFVPVMAIWMGLGNAFFVSGRFSSALGQVGVPHGVSSILAMAVMVAVFFSANWAMGQFPWVREARREAAEAYPADWMNYRSQERRAGRHDNTEGNK